MADTDKQPNISILIPTRNNETDLLDCLRSIENLDYPLYKIELIIWDNNSRPESKLKTKDFIIAMTKKDFVNIRFIENTSNFGVYTSRDELCKRVTNDTQFVLSIDDDVILPANLLNELIPNFQNDSSVGIIGPRTVFDNEPSQTAHGAGFVNWWLGRYTDVDTMNMMECDYVIGCCMLINKSVIEEIGGFDLDYYTSHGEVDFCIKAKQKGYKTLYCPKVVVRHRVDRGGTKTPERRYYLYRNKIFLIKKNAPIPQKWVSLFLYSLFWLPKNILDSIIRNSGFDYNEVKIMIKAMKDGWLNKTGKRF
jgi:GT2 family glycosyltransferase